MHAKEPQCCGFATERPTARSFESQQGLKIPTKPIGFSEIVSTLGMTVR